MTALARTLIAGIGATLLTLATAPIPAHAGLLGNAINKSINGHGDGPVWTEHADGFKGVSQVVLGQFSVVFITKTVSYSGGGFLSTSGSAKAIGQLAGVDAATYQQVTDAVYADFLKKLATSGITVADPAAYYASHYYQSVKSEEQGHSVTMPLEDKDSVDAVAYWPTAMTHRDNFALNLRFMDAGRRDVYTAEYDYARTSGIPVLNVVYVVDFAEPAKSSGGGAFQSIKVSAALAISPRGSQMVLMDTRGNPAKIVLNKPLAEEGAFAEIRDITSGLQKSAESAQMIGNVAGALFGGKGGMFGKQMRMDRRFEYRVTDPANYSSLATHAGGQANDLMLGQLGLVR